MKKTQSLSLCLAAVLVFAGCSGAVGKQAGAIDEMLASYNGYHIKAEDIAKQLSAQQTEESAASASYNIKLQIPDFAAIPPDELAPVFDFADWNEPDQEQFDESVRSAVEAAALAYVEANGAPAYLTNTVQVEVAQGKDGAWTAEMPEKSAASLQADVADMVEDLTAESPAAQDAYAMLGIAQDRENLLSQLFADSAFAALAKITGITAAGKGQYDVQLTYPDPAKVYPALAEAAVSAYDAPVFEEADIDLSPNDETAPALAGVPTLTGSFTVQGDAESGFTVPAAATEKFDVSAARTAAEDSANQRITDAWRVYPEENPSSGVLYGSPGANTCIINTGADSGDYYLRFYALSGPNLSEDGTLALGVYITGGSSFTTSLSSGYYRLVYGTGTEWFGTEYMFGPGGDYSQMDSVVDSSAGYYNELTLYHVEGGNASTSPVPFYTD